jgi:hypothetical protein
VKPLDDIAEGMTYEQVHGVLVGWNPQVVNAVISDDHVHLFQAWDFVPPVGSVSEAQRMIFHNGKLVAWGDPASTRIPLAGA